MTQPPRLPESSPEEAHRPEPEGSHLPVEGGAVVPLTPPESPYEWVNGVAKGVAVTSGLAAGYFFFMHPGSWGLAALIPLFLVSAVVYKVTGWGAEAADGTLRGALGEKLEDIWENQAASFYGLVSGTTFLTLEALDLITGLRQAGRLTDFLGGEIIGFLIGFAWRSLGNLIEAALWPLGWFQRWGILGLVAMGVGYAAWGVIHDWVDRARGVGPRLLPQEPVEPEG